MKEKKHPFQALAKAINEDPEYAWGWHCNIAVNVAAARIMRTIFSVDMFKHPMFPKE